MAGLGARGRGGGGSAAPNGAPKRWRAFGTEFELESAIVCPRAQQQLADGGAIAFVATIGRAVR